MRTISWLFFLVGLLPTVASASSIGIQTIAAYIHADGALETILDTSSSSYFSTLVADDTGTFGWTITNTTDAMLTDVSLLGFLDADLDSDINTFFNEYGVFLGLSLPPGAPGGSIEASSWQIDEPGYVFGTIIDDLLAGTLRDENFVPSSAPDDVSLALGFFVGDLAPNQTAALTLQISSSNIGGLQQVDPDSGSTLFLNGYTTVSSAAISSSPEPDSFVLLGAGFGLCFLLRRRK